MTKTILRLDASARRENSVTRELSGAITERLGADRVIHRDLAQTPLPQLDEAWVGANFTPADQRDDAQKAALALSDSLIEELRAADVIVIGVPIYNFGAPAALKAWVDLVARAGVTFRYTDEGPKGLLDGKRAILAVASGGVGAGSEVDFASNYMRHVLGFIGVTDVDIVAADRMALDPEGTLNAARQQVADLAA
ncbi:FMN-dependent NADH-azoreductase [Poseidonocella pacifica]|uniref:FMN-dependent NADH-azoreductase n=1 Tax=Poseidonocella pacifica TaxID=871651 RepID=UPI000A72BF87|nr:NAD(P)H-dependent oxidoreductase [Poseidonocella pacifica]